MLSRRELVGGLVAMVAGARVAPAIAEAKGQAGGMAVGYRIAPGAYQETPTYHELARLRDATTPQSRIIAAYGHTAILEW